MQAELNYDTIDEFKVIKILGAGAQGKVYLCENKNAQKVAVKLYLKQSAQSLQIMTKELNVAKKLNHENIVKLIDYRDNARYNYQDGTSKDYVALILEYLEGGELFNFIAKTKRFSEMITKTFFIQMMKGLHHMHSKGLVHRDLKPQNIVLSSDFKVKITDFGLARPSEPDECKSYLCSMVGSPGYVAPEIGLGKYDGQKVDIFSSGVVLFIMYSGFRPFYDATNSDLSYRHIISKNYAQFWNPFEQSRGKYYYSSQFKDLIQRMLAYDPKERITMVEIFSHPWIRYGLRISQNQIVHQFSIRKKEMEIKLEKERLEKIQREKLYMEALNIKTENQSRERIIYSQRVEQKFILMIQEEVKLNRNLPLDDVPHNQDVVLLVNPVYGISYLKLFLSRLFLNLQGSPHSSESIENQQMSQTLKFDKLKDGNKDKIYFYFRLYQRRQGQQRQQKLLISFDLALDRQNNLILRPKKEEGDVLAFRMVICQVKKAFDYAIVQK